MVQRGAVTTGSKGGGSFRCGSCGGQTSLMSLWTAILTETVAASLSELFWFSETAGAS